MDFAVIHEIQDAKLWQQALDGNDDFPEDFDNLVFVEAVDKSRALCVWQAPTEAALQSVLDKVFGSAAANHVFPVDIHRLPQTQTGG